MEQKNFKQVGDKLAFNSQHADPIFTIIQETEHGYLYFQESKPFGPVNFVWKDNVIEEVQETEDVSPPKKEK